ncbi:MAG: hypothetical protein K6G29_00785 [Clostridiales bacterium]|nr:hypothetical protein [Clostridiales bacterium]
MFQDVGKKLKVIAQILFWVGILGDVAFAIFIINTSAKYLVFMGTPVGIIGAIVMILLIAFASWVSALLLYAYGQLVDDVSAIRRIDDNNPRVRSVSISSTEAVSAKTEILRHKLHAGEITPEQYNKAIEQLKKNYNY